VTDILGSSRNLDPILAVRSWHVDIVLSSMDRMPYTLLAHNDKSSCFSTELNKLIIQSTTYLLNTDFQLARKHAQLASPVMHIYKTAQHDRECSLTQTQLRNEANTNWSRCSQVHEIMIFVNAVS